jgi:hypothetical protein
MRGCTTLLKRLGPRCRSFLHAINGQGWLRRGPSKTNIRVASGYDSYWAHRIRTGVLPS